MTAARSFDVSIAPRDPVIARDGRPFSLGLRMRSLDWLYPSVTAGAVRTLVGEFTGGFSDPEIYSSLTARLKDLAVRGPLLRVHASGVNASLCVPAPLDIAVQRLDSGRLRSFPIRPWDPGPNGGSCDELPGYSLLPAVREQESEDFKPVPVPPFWSLDRMATWLVGEPQSVADFDEWPNGCFQGIARDTRVHVGLNELTGASREGMLFMTSGLDMTRVDHPRGTPSADAEIALNVQTTDAAFAGALTDLATWSPLGGERRLARWVSHERPDSLWSVPHAVREALNKGPRFVRMILATPALFDHGWRPDWLRLENRRLVGKVPDTQLVVRLIGAIVERWRPVSGWSYEPPIGPKAVRRMVPAGSVYFFRVEQGEAADLSSRWLQSVSDKPQDGRDGFGLATWGTWKPLRPEQFEKDVR